MSKILNEKVVSMENLAADIYKLTVSSPTLAAASLPGQFLNIKCSDGIAPLLRRPISICNADRENGTADIVFQVKGEGTALLSKKKPGDLVDIMGPLGNSFDIGYKFSRIAVIGGGIGVFPLLYLLSYSDAIIKRAYLGFRSKEFITLEEEFKSVSNSLAISTDDGSFGYNGYVTDMFAEDIVNSRPDMIYACGPKPMLKNVVSIADANGIPCQVSLEERMGCGIGACLVCACRTKDPAGGEGLHYSHVCKDGPIFWSKDVVFE
ncbi:MAG: dihydroorotate dehydrogenase electron transfer subunit [Clostridiales bacterium]|nr:dihydroorotate dehydrogenase electron transfer subunit [Clostridiales bacterium]